MMVVRLDDVRDRTPYRPWRIRPTRAEGGPALLVEVPARFGHPEIREVIPIEDPSDAKIAHDFAALLLGWMARRMGR